MKAKAAGLTSETSQGRRAVLAGLLAAVVPLPVLAASAPVGAREAEFLALAADLLSLVRRLGPAQVEWRRRNEAADIEGGPFPGWRDEAVGSAWLARLTASRDYQRCSEVWDVANEVSVAVATREQRHHVPDARAAGARPCPALAGRDPPHDRGGGTGRP